MLAPFPEQLVRHNAKIKVYPDGSRKVTVCTRPIFKDSGWEEIKEEEETETVAKPKDMTKKEVRSDNMKRAKEKAFDIARLNDFEYFTTWTLNKDLIDRYDADEIKKKLKIFLNNGVKRKNLLYLVLPEYHKDGAIHMHALIRGDYRYLDSGLKTKSGQPIYNMPDWGWGFSTAIPIYGDKEAVSRYITKYITKDCQKIFGSFYYAGGKGLVRTPVIQYDDMDFNVIQAETFPVPVAKMGFKYFWDSSDDVQG